MSRVWGGAVLLWTASVVGSGAAGVEFQAPGAGEAVADLELSSPGSDWSVGGREAALADVLIDGRAAFNVMVVTGGARHTYPVFLGPLTPGRHRIEVVRNGRYSAPGSPLAVHGIKIRAVAADSGEFAILAHAPVLYGRKNTIGRFTDVPLIAYGETLHEGGSVVLQYTIIFSNEDGGTSTRALMARWGRTTDIEYVYRVALEGGSGRTLSATVQARNHKETAFEGRRAGRHPLLIPVTDNNMVTGEDTSAISYQMAPLAIDLAEHTREYAMDLNPFTYGVMRGELVREAKLRPYGAVDGENIGDPRNYLGVEYKVRNANSGVGTLVRLAKGRRWYASHLGLAELAISRDGWVRTMIELPPGTRAADVAEIGFECLILGKDARQGGPCVVETVSGAFFFDPQDGKPQPPFWSLGEQVSVAAGQAAFFPAAPR
jgi:hypothetical protein